MALSDYPPYQLRNLQRTLAAQVPHKAVRDLLNRLRFGPDAPQSDETLILPLSKITRGYVPSRAKGAPKFRRRHSGLVRGGNWDLSTIDIVPNRIERSLRARLLDGADWQETEIFAHALAEVSRHGVFDDCRSVEDVHARYARIDAIAAEARATGRLRPQASLPNRFRREHGGVLAHLDRNGNAIRFGGGQHRFALARTLNLHDVPVQVGVIHPDALAAGFVQRYRPTGPYTV